MLWEQTSLPQDAQSAVRTAVRVLGLLELPVNR